MPVSPANGEKRSVHHGHSHSWKPAFLIARPRYDIPSSEEKKMGAVYILRSGEGDLFKIGMTRGDVDVRKKGLATGNPHPLTEYASLETDDPSKVESFLQGLLRSKRSRRSEATEFYEVAQAELDTAIQEARDYADHDLPQEAEVERLAAESCEDRLITPVADDWAAYAQLLRARETHDRATHARNRLEWTLKLRIGTAYGLDGIATWRTITAKRFDAEAFGRDHPDLHNAYLRESHSRRFDLR
jgi:hypothetical protein